MRIGRRDRQITLQRFTESADWSGEKVKTWADLATVWAHRKTQSGKEALQANQPATEQTVVFNIRYYALTTLDRVLYEGKIYDITALNEVGRRKEVELICKANG